MKAIKLIYPPLTPEDILVLKGKPVSKRIEVKRSLLSPKIEEWIYYNKFAEIKESYCFKNGWLIKYKANEIFT